MQVLQKLGGEPAQRVEVIGTRIANALKKVLLLLESLSVYMHTCPIRYKTVGTSKFIDNCTNTFLSCQDYLFLRSKLQRTSGLDQISYRT